jgi:hypothetical protein
VVACYDRHQEREEPQRDRTRLVQARLVLAVDTKTQVVATGYTMTRQPDLLPRTLDL